MEEATWEEEFNIKSQFPHLRLEDKSHFEEGGIDRNGNMGQYTDGRPKVWMVYVRRYRGKKSNGGVANEITE